MGISDFSLCLLPSSGKASALAGMNQLHPTDLYRQIVEPEMLVAVGIKKLACYRVIFNDCDL